MSKWDNTKYYNLWVVSEIDGNNGGAGTQGFAYFPGAGSNIDGAVMLYNAFGYDPTGTLGYNLKPYTNRNRTLIHEIGHGLGLYHTFQGDDSNADGVADQCPTNATCSTQGDRVCDTPPHQRSVSDCTSGTNACDGNSSRELFIHNYMDYSSDVCQNEFTAGQASRMTAVVAPAGSRQSLSTFTNLDNCGCNIPVPRFTVSNTTPCLGSSIQFVDESINFPTSWTWTFSGGTPPSSNSQNPTVTYATTGTFNVSLTAISATGVSSTTTKIAYINPIGAKAVPFLENFEGTFPPQGWSSISGDGATTWGNDGSKTFEKRTAAGNTGSTLGAVGINCYNYNSGGTNLDALISPPINLSGLSVANLTYKTAYRFYSASNADTLKVYVSNDCGNTFTKIQQLGGTQLSSVTSGSSFTPSVVSDWVLRSVNLDTYVGQNIIVKFEVKNQYGQNVYFDDVNVTGTGASNSITTSTISGSPFCVGETGISVPYSITGTYVTGNIFTAQLSNSAGSFASPTVLGTLSSTTAGTINTTVGMPSTTGTGYRIRVVSSNPAITGSDNGINLSIVNKPSAAAAATNVSCYGSNNGAINLTPSGGTPGYTYNWGGGITTKDRTGLAAGNYSVTITDANGCTALTTATVTQPSSAISSSATVINTSCYGSNNGAINLTPSGGTPGYTYNWGGGITTEDRTGLAAGNYSVTITDANACVHVSSFTITQPTSLSISSTITHVSCMGGNDGTINISPSGGTPNYTFNWGGGITTEDRTGLTAGNYSVTITDENSCTAITSVTVNDGSSVLPTVSINSSTTSICVGALVTFTASPTNGGTPTFQWKVNGSNAGSNSATFVSSFSSNSTVSCEMTSSIACAIPSMTTSNVISITTGGATINISQHPSSENVCFNSVAEFSIVAINVNAYQWQVNDGSGFSNIANGSVYSGVTTSILTITNLSGLNSYSYRCILTGDCGTLNSNSATLIVDSGTAFYQDLDNDGFGNPSVSIIACTSPLSYVANNTDCDDSDNLIGGSPCGPVGPTTQLSSSCGATGLLMNSYLYAQALSGATDYEFTFTNLTLGYNKVVYRRASFANIYLSNVTGLKYNTTYNVKVRAKLNGVWTNFGATCSISTGAFPTTQLNGTSCGATNLLLSSYLYAEPSPAATDYEFTFTNTSLGYNKVAYRGGAFANILLSNVAGLQFGQSYDVIVKAKIGGEWSPIGTTCQITLANAPTTQLSSSCGAVNLTLSSTIYADAIAGATKYEFKFVNSSLGYSRTVVRNSAFANYNLSTVSGLLMGQTYQVTVRAYAGSAWTLPGAICSISIGGIARAANTESLAFVVENNNEVIVQEVVEVISEQFKTSPIDEDFSPTSNASSTLEVMVYPNPISKTSILSIGFNVKDIGKIILMDITGRIITEQNFNTNLQSSVEVNLAERKLDNGIYNLSIIGNKSTSQKTIVVVE